MRDELQIVFSQPIVPETCNLKKGVKGSTTGTNATPYV